MHTTQPIPENPWPHDMVISVQDDPDTLLSLLWIREAWRLNPEGADLPPQLTDTPTPIPEPSSRYRPSRRAV